MGSPIKVSSLGASKKEEKSCSVACLIACRIDEGLTSKRMRVHTSLGREYSTGDIIEDGTGVAREMDGQDGWDTAVL